MWGGWAAAADALRCSLEPMLLSPLPALVALPDGRGLLRASLTVEVEEEGVRTGDWPAESRAVLDDEGEAVPSLESLFFLDALLGSLLRESWERRRGGC